MTVRRAHGQRQKPPTAGTTGFVTLQASGTRKRPCRLKQRPCPWIHPPHDQNPAATSNAVNATPGQPCAATNCPSSSKPHRNTQRQRRPKTPKPSPRLAPFPPHHGYQTAHSPRLPARPLQLVYEPAPGTEICADTVKITVVPLIILGDSTHNFYGVSWRPAGDYALLVGSGGAVSRRWPQSLE